MLKSAKIAYINMNLCLCIVDVDVVTVSGNSIIVGHIIARTAVARVHSVRCKLDGHARVAADIQALVVRHVAATRCRLRVHRHDHRAVAADVVAVVVRLRPAAGLVV